MRRIPGKALVTRTPRATRIPGSAAAVPGLLPKRSVVMGLVVICLAGLTPLMTALPARATQEKTVATWEMLPPSGSLAGWLLTEEPEQFLGEDLWKHINGAADQYLSFGCTSLTVGYYSRNGSDAPGTGSADDSEIAIEIYRMEGELGSFGLYTLERPPKGPYLEIGAQGYQAGSDLNFFGSPYYLKLRAYPEEEAELQAARKLAEIIAAQHLAGSTFPAELQFFPRERLVENSFGLVPKAVLGLKGLSNALVARYRSPGPTPDHSEEMALHLVREKSPQAAEAAFSAVRESLKKRSTVPLRQITIGTGEGVRGELKYRGPVLLLRSGKDIVLAAGTADQDWMHETISLLLANLARQGLGR